MPKETPKAIKTISPLRSNNVRNLFGLSSVGYLLTFADMEVKNQRITGIVAIASNT